MLSFKNSFVCEGTSSDEAISKKNFCGRVFESVELFNESVQHAKSVVYLAGNIEMMIAKIRKDTILMVVEELSTNFETCTRYKIVRVSQLPVNVENVGVFFPKLFLGEKDFYESVVNEHKFQLLKLANKPGEAFRKGFNLHCFWFKFFSFFFSKNRNLLDSCY
jgi:hypothetical protein